MNTEIKSIFSEAEGRYLEDQEAAVLNRYASTLSGRLEAMEAVRSKEKAIVEETVEAVWRKHPEVETKWSNARQTTIRDITLVLRYCTMAMVRDDMEFLRDKLLYWMRSILQAFQMGPILDTAYRALPRRVEAHLSPGYVKLLAPYLKETHRILTKESLQE